MVHVPIIWMPILVYNTGYDIVIPQIVERIFLKSLYSTFACYIICYIAHHISHYNNIACYVPQGIQQVTLARYIYYNKVYSTLARYIT